MDLSKEKYENIINMLLSDDQENVVLGLSILNELDFHKNIVEILLIKKHARKTNAKLYEEHAPKLWEYLKELENNNILNLKTQFTYKYVMSVLTKLDCNSDQLQFFMQDFSEYLYKQCVSMGFDFIERLDIKLKYKELHEQSGELSQSV